MICIDVHHAITGEKHFYWGDVIFKLNLYLNNNIWFIQLTLLKLLINVNLTSCLQFLTHVWMKS